MNSGAAISVFRCNPGGIAASTSVRSFEQDLERDPQASAGDLGSAYPARSLIDGREKSPLNAAAKSLGCDLPARFMSLSFLRLSPIPA